MRILVTNDDGIDSVGLHRLAIALTAVGDVTIVAPDREFSGAGASIGALWDLKPVVRRHHIDGVPKAWTLNGSPGLCVLWSRLGLFGDDFDLVVSGINPGANVGTSVYYSGTVGACLVARNIGLSSIAVSQKFSTEYIGQAIADIVADQIWDTAVSAAAALVGGIIKGGLPDDPVVINMNVPNVAIDDIRGWKRVEIGVLPSWSAAAELVPLNGNSDEFTVQFDRGKSTDANGPGSDQHELDQGYVTLSYLSRLEAQDRSGMGAAESSLDAVFGS